MDNRKLNSIVNGSGFPLQIGISHLISKTKNSHGWQVLYEEHAWSNQRDKTSGFIDLVLENQHRVGVLVVECKRVLDSSWIFLNHTEGKNENRTHFKSLISQSKTSQKKFASSWNDIPLEPSSLESEYCIVPGQDSKAKPMLERTAAEVISATRAIADEEFDLLLASESDFLRVYCGVIVTTAKLLECKLDPSTITITDGTLPESTFREVPFVRFRKQLSTKGTVATDGLSTLSRAKESSVFIVNSLHLQTFLEEWDIGSNALRRILLD